MPRLPSPSHRHRQPLRSTALSLPITALVLSSCNLIGGDCAWLASAHAWVDQNGNGTWESKEPPLPDVRFQVNDIENDYSDVAQPATTDAQGWAGLAVFLAGCPSAQFEVISYPPTGYRSLLTDPMQITDYGHQTTLLFPFEELPVISTPASPHNQ